jgi:hypothetical protein
MNGDLRQRLALEAVRHHHWCRDLPPAAAGAVVQALPLLDLLVLGPSQRLPSYACVKGYQIIVIIMTTIFIFIKMTVTIIVVIIIIITIIINIIIINIIYRTITTFYSLWGPTGHTCTCQVLTCVNQEVF